MKHSSGFTVIELIVVIALLASASVLFFVQKNAIEVSARDNQRKTAINAMYYALEEIYVKQNGSYPRTLSASTLPSVDPALFTDPEGIAVGQTSVTINDTAYPVESNYRYEPTGCVDDACTGYTLRSTLENEADFVRSNPTED